ncbi:ABC transporter permease [Facklamia miroungae]|uniref:Putative ABC transport system permease protein n=1 Tax=Facklamia miroungae TaxID=120956 RepID=A0A1G7TI49_9LACT|nr:ABC transporter permease [Facklamia miroungae]NKZ29849.1 FtsX-like permease family protein [Facklamia miroungae]SDG34220.1 putative ABC transport system permease protein [Facklamia miroungae]
MKSIIKDIFREITKSFPRFLSILAIVFLGTAFFIGIKATGPAMVETARDYYETYDLPDGRILSSQGMNENDLKRLEDEAQLRLRPVKSVVGMVEPSTQPIKVYGVSQQDRENYKIIKGRFPEKAAEIALDSKYLDLINADIEEPVQLGDRVKIAINKQPIEGEIDSDNPDSIFSVTDSELASNEYEVVGFVQTPLYYERITRGLDYSVFGLVSEDQLKTSYYSEVFYWIKNIEGKAYDPNYQHEVDEVKKKMEDLLASRPDERLEASKKDIQVKYDELSADLEKAKKDFEAAKKSLSEASNTLADSDQELQTAQLDLSDIEANLLQQSVQGNIDPSNPQALGSQQEQEELIEGQKQSLTGKNKLFFGSNQLQRSQETFVDNVGENNLELREGQLALEELIDLQNDLKAPSYYVNTREDEAAYKGLKENADKLDVISNLFPVFFFAIAVLVVFTTVKRMSSEQRNYMGTMQQMGYDRWQVILKFVVYAGLAGVIGIGLGLTLGYQIFPPIILQAYNSMYYLDSLLIPKSAYWNLIVGAIALACTLIPAIYTPYILLKQAPAQLLRPEPPKQGKQILLEKWTGLWDRLSFNRKMTLRNLFRYKGRNITTFIGVAGCSMLILTGFGISDTISGLLSTQFEQLQRYDATLVLKEEQGHYKTQNLEEELNQFDEIEAFYPIHSESLDIENEKEKENVTLMIPLGEPNVFEEFVSVRQRSKDKDSDPIDLEKEGPVYTERLAELFDLKPGSKASFKLDDETYSIPLKGAAENYVNHYLYMGTNDYSQVFKKPAKVNAFLLKYKENAKGTSLEDQLQDIEEVQAVVNMGNVEDVVNKTMDSLYVITIVLIVSAAGLAFVVLYNLTNINIEERNRELATIKVLGFYAKEVSFYVYEEIFIITVLGSFFGLLAGRVLTHVIMKQMQMNSMLFYPRATLQSYLISFVLTFVFSSSVMLIMHHKIKRINMVEALKGLD